MNDWTKLILGKENSQTAPVCNGQIRDMISDILSLQAQLAERDKTILEQQARILALISVLTEYDTEFTCVDDLSALEAHDREVRIKCLEDAAKHFADTQKGREVKAELLHFCAWQTN